MDERKYEGIKFIDQIPMFYLFVVQFFIMYCDSGKEASGISMFQVLEIEKYVLLPFVADMVIEQGNSYPFFYFF